VSDALEAQYDVGHGVGFWIQVTRALLLLTLGLSLIFIPDKTDKVLFNAMGLYWLTTGLVLIRQEAHKGGNRLWLVFAIFGVLTGLLVLTRSLSRQWVPEVWVKGLLGAIILLTGLLHTVGVLSAGRRAFSGRPLVDLMLGVATIILGALVLTGRTGREQIVYYLATVWALLWSGLILFSAGRQWLRERRQKQAGKGVEKLP
jgi:uncharacterized membrane protein HdeD (DUF308 family)